MSYKLFKITNCDLDISKITLSDECIKCGVVFILHLCTFKTPISFSFSNYLKNITNKFFI